MASDDTVPSSTSTDMPYTFSKGKAYEPEVAGEKQCCHSDDTREVVDKQHE